jgi:hypothetical protein
MTRITDSGRIPGKSWILSRNVLLHILEQEISVLLTHLTQLFS